MHWASSAKKEPMLEAPAAEESVGGTSNITKSI